MENEFTISGGLEVAAGLDTKDVAGKLKSIAGKDLGRMTDRDLERMRGYLLIASEIIDSLPSQQVKGERVEGRPVEQKSGQQEERPVVKESESINDKFKRSVVRAGYNVF